MVSRVRCGTCLHRFLIFAFFFTEKFKKLNPKRKRKLTALLLLSYRCIVTINALWLFLTAAYVGLQCVIVVFPDHTHLLFC